MVVPSVLWRESPSSNVMQAPRVVCEIPATHVGILRQSEKRREDTLTASRAPSSVVHHKSNHTRLAQGRAHGEHTALRSERSRGSGKVEECVNPNLLAFDFASRAYPEPGAGLSTSENGSHWR